MSRWPGKRSSLGYEQNTVPARAPSTTPWLDRAANGAGNRARQPRESKQPCPGCVARARQIEQLEENREIALIGGVALLGLVLLWTLGA